MFDLFVNCFWGTCAGPVGADAIRSRGRADHRGSLLEARPAAIHKATASWLLGLGLDPRGG